MGEANIKSEVHETFEIVEQEKNKRLKIIRQDRFESAENNFIFEIENKALKILNYSSFGLALAIPKDQNFKTDLRGNAVFDGFEINELHIKPSRIEAADDYNIVACEILGEPLNVAAIESIKLANIIISKHSEKLKGRSLVPHKFKALIYEMKDFLSELEIQTKEIEENISKFGNRTSDVYLENIALAIGHHLSEHFSSYYKNAGDILTTVNDEEKKASVEFFREKLSQLIYGAPIANRIYNKPLGYAGDFEMMNHIYKTTAQGKSLLDKCMHNFFVRDPAAAAVRNRAVYLSKKIKKIALLNKNKRIKVLSIACGPAYEIQMLMDSNQLPDNIDFYLLDQDENALKHAQLEIKKRSNKQTSNKFYYLNKAIKNIIVKGLDSSDFDLIYSAGLFDYFSDPVAQLAASKLIQGLNQNGELIIGNFNISNPSQPIMEIALDWHLIYRSEEDLTRLYNHICSSFEIESEMLGINLFCIMKK